MPGKVGMVSGLFFGLAFGIGGIGAALLGHSPTRPASSSSSSSARSCRRSGCSPLCSRTSRRAAAAAREPRAVVDAAGAGSA